MTAVSKEQADPMDLRKETRELNKPALSLIERIIEKHVKAILEELLSELDERDGRLVKIKDLIKTAEDRRMITEEEMRKIYLLAKGETKPEGYKQSRRAKAEKR